MTIQTAAESDLRSVAERAYIYAYPLVLIEETRGVTPVNRLTHAPIFPRPEDRQIVRPNADTLYSTAWIDVSSEPIMIHVPDSAGRFYLLQFMDAWTETFADPGKRTTGTAEAWFAIVGPGWKGILPENVTRLDSATNIVWLLGRTQTNGPSDYDNVHAFQRQMFMLPLSAYPNGEHQVGSPHAFGAVHGTLTPPYKIKAMQPVEFFAAFADALKANPPHAADAPIVAELALLGLIPGDDFDASKLIPGQLRAINEGALAASLRIESLVSAPHEVKPGWGSFSVTMGRYGAEYIRRAAVARLGLGANLTEDALYVSSAADATGQPLDGSLGYRLHFEKSELPPVRAFWSITIYDQDGYFIPNPIHRYAIGDRDPLKFNPDGSLDLLIQHQNPGPDHERNWLPSGEGSFNLTFRLYWPEEPILKGAWHPPALERQ